MNKEKIRCLASALLIKLSQALILTWGQMNLYYYSYYKHSDPSLRINVNYSQLTHSKWTNLGFLIYTPFIALFELFSMRIAERFGYQKTILVGQIVQTIGMIISPFMPNFYLFLFFYLFLPGLSFGICAFPTMGCVWSHFRQNQGRITGIVLGFYSLMSLAYTIILTLMINPHNEEATETVYEGKQEFHFFNYDVAYRVKKSLIIISIFVTSTGLLGSIFITHRPHHEITTNKVAIEMTEAKSQKANQSNGEINNEQSSDQNISSEISNDQINENQSNNQQIDELNPEEKLMIKPFQICTDDIKNSVRSSDFLILYYAYTTMVFFVIFLGINFKKYMIEKINDDHFIVMAASVAHIISSCMNIVWGYVSDFSNYKWMSFAFIFITGILVFIFPICASQKVSFCFILILLSLFDRGFLVLIGPGLIRIYGPIIGPQLNPILNSGTMLAFILVPCYQWIFIEVLSFDRLIQISAGFLISGALVFLALKAKTPPVKQFRKSQ